MPRGPRDDAPGVAHHVMLRGIERRPIFRGRADRLEFQRRLASLLPELRFRCFAWVLMPNHAHLVVRSADTPISRLMARLSTGYAGYFNRRHDRVGHLFQNRFRSRRADDDADLTGLVLYVSRNPLEAGLVATPGALERFPWCGVGALLGRRAPHAFESVRETLELFDADPERARQRIRAWLGAPGVAVPGAPEPAPAVQRAARPAPAAARLEDLLREACAAFGVTPDEVRSRSRGRRVAAARSALSLRALEHGSRGVDVARWLRVTEAAVSRMIARERAARAAARVKK